MDKNANAQPATDQPQPQPSVKHNVTATVASTAVTVVLGIAAQILIGKVSARVHDQIAKPQPQSE